VDGNRATIATQVEGVLAAGVDSDFPDPPDTHSLSGQIAIYTSGRFLWPQVRTANPSFVFDPVSINTLKAKNITFEAVAFGLWQPVDRQAVKMATVFADLIPGWVSRRDSVCRLGACQGCSVRGNMAADEHIP
jgi:hypothetical protein